MQGTRDARRRVAPAWQNCHQSSRLMPEALWSKGGWLGPRQIDLLPQPVLPDQLIVGEARLQVLADHVNVLKVALNQVSLIDCRDAGEIINAINYVNRQSNPVRGGQTQGRALLLGRPAGRRRLGPELADRLAEEGPARSKIGFGAAHSTLNHRLITERRLHSPRCLSAGQLEKRDEAGAGHP